MRFQFVVAVAVASMLGSSLAARANTIYTYTGQHFTDVQGSYTTTEFVSGSFTVATAIAPNAKNISIVPLSYMFSDGNQTVTTADQFRNFFTGFSTNASGMITQYDVLLQRFSNQIHVSNDTQNNSTNIVFDEGMSARGLGFSFRAGTFTANAAPTPEPSSVLLLGTGVLGLMGAVRRRFAA